MGNAGHYVLQHTYIRCHQTFAHSPIKPAFASNKIFVQVAIMLEHFNLLAG